MKLKAALALSILPVLFSSQALAFTVGVVMPTQVEPRWYSEGFGVEQLLKATVLMLSSSLEAILMFHCSKDKLKDYRMTAISML